MVTKLKAVETVSILGALALFLISTTSILYTQGAIAQSGCQPVANPNTNRFDYLGALYGPSISDMRKALTTGTSDRCSPEYGDTGYDKHVTGAGMDLDEYESVEESYYYTVDPSGQRTTLKKWRRLHGLDDFRGNESRDVVNASYINAYDLGLGRKMSCRPTSSISSTAYPCVVENYVVGPDAKNPDEPQLFASVAMERIRATSSSGSSRYYTAFFVFDANGNRINSIDLDGHGEKRVPESCWSCHDGGKSAIGSRNGQYLAFDVDLFEQFPGGPSILSQWDSFRRLNDIVYRVAQSEKTVSTDDDSHKNIEAMLENWYDGRPLSASFRDINFNRAGALVATRTSHVNREAFYEKYCRTCHVSQTEFNYQVGSTNIAYLTFGEDLPSPSGTDAGFNCLICHEPTNEKAYPSGLRYFDSVPEVDTSAAGNLQSMLCANGSEVQMPNARVTHQQLISENLAINGRVRSGTLLAELESEIEGDAICTAGQYAPRPKNDLWYYSEKITAKSTFGSLVEANQDGAASVGQAGRPDVWFQFTPERTATYHINTCGTHDAEGINRGVDTVLSVHIAFGTGTVSNEIAANDNWWSGSDSEACDGFDNSIGRDSAVAVELTAGERVRIRVAARGIGDLVKSGKFRLQVLEGAQEEMCFPIVARNGAITVICL